MQNFREYFEMDSIQTVVEFGEDLNKLMAINDFSGYYYKLRFQSWFNFNVIFTKVSSLLLN